MRGVEYRVGYHSLLAAACGAAVGAVDGAVHARAVGVHFALAAAVGAGLVATIAAGVGLLQALLLRAYRALRGRLAGDLPNSGGGAGVDERLGNAASALSGVIGAALFGAWLFVLSRALERVKEPSLREILLLMGAVGAAAALLWLGVVLRPTLKGWLHPFARRFGLPYPHSRALRYVVYVFLPVSGSLLPLFWLYGVKLGISSRVFGLGWFICLQGLAHYAIVQPLTGSSWVSRLGRRGTASIVGGLMLLVGTAAVGLQASPALSTLSSQASVLPVAAGALRNATDVDRDGISSLFGGADCAPFDPARSPGSFDRPANGIDEDCDGRDAEPGETRDLRAFLKASSPKRPMNVLLLIIDSLRPDHMDLYGYKKKTSPFLKSFGGQSWVFNKAFSQSSTTRLSVPSMLSGRAPGSMQWAGGLRARAMPSEFALAELLTNEGYLTTFVANAYVKRVLNGLSRGYSQFRVAPPAYNWRSGDVAVSYAISAMEDARRREKPFFITVHFDDVHHPYQAHRGRSVPALSDKRKDVQDYDRCIANMDNLLRVLMEHVKQLKLLEDTVVMITSDHGEEFLEHGGTIHSATCYTESVHVPLVVRIPGESSSLVDAPVALVDLVPTVLEALGLQSKAPKLDGQSLFIPSKAPSLVSPERPITCSIYQMFSGRKGFFTRSLRTREFAFIFDSLSNRTELYDTSVDPRESEDLSAAPEHAERLQTFRRQLSGSLTGNLFQTTQAR